MPKAALPAIPALISAAGGNRFGFDDFRIQDLQQKKLYCFPGYLNETYPRRHSFFARLDALLGKDSWPLLMNPHSCAE
jgi:hypothetical protein